VANRAGRDLSVRQRAVLLAVRLGAVVVPAVPERLAYPAADIAGFVAYGLAAPARPNAADNISSVVDRHDVDLLALRVREAFRTQTRNYVDLFRLPALSLAEIERRVEVVGEAHLRAAHGRGKGTILGALHLGNVDVLPQAGRQFGYHIVVPVEPLDPPELFELVSKMRAAHGVRLLPVGPGIVPELLAALEAGAVIPFAVDRHVQGTGARTPFLGRTARLSHAAVALALRSGAPLLPVRGERLPGSRYRVTIGPPIDRPAGQRGRAAIRGMTDGLLGALSEFVRQTPGQWVMFQRLFDGAG
jgi:lauroyl/myristoyl acyltransferase